MPETDQSTSLNAEQQGELEKRLQKGAVKNRIPCSSAMAIAKALGVSNAEVGKAANRLKIRISKCQLGCF